MAKLIDVLASQQIWIHVFGTFALVCYRYVDNNWLYQLGIGVLILSLALAGFVTAEAVNLVAFQAGAENEVQHTVNAARFGSSVIWAALGVGLVHHAVTRERSK